MFITEKLIRTEMNIRAMVLQYFLMKRECEHLRLRKDREMKKIYKSLDSLRGNNLLTIQRKNIVSKFNADIKYYVNVSICMNI